ncbi:MAG TPA: response regulator transcription factor [Steroidobacteraceae bacterium]|jgi:DNA-binding NarL/FixJ family response regulator
MKLLIIDDHPLMREGLIALLQQAAERVEVLQAAGGTEGLALVERHDDLDAIFLDLAMPDGGGMAVIRALGERRPDVPVIVLSASEDPADVRSALSLGALGYVPKSANPMTLLSALRLVLSGNIYVPPLVLAPGNTETRDGPASPASAAPQLTERQLEILQQLCRGLSNREIGRELDIAEKTVKAHVAAIFKALNVVSRTQAVGVARASALI